MIKERLFVLTSILLLLSAVSAAAAPDKPSRSVPERRAYTIGIEDVLAISVWGEPNLAVTARVRPDGKISLPLADEVQAEGYTLQELRNEIRMRLEQFIREPNVTVMLAEHNSFRVYVLGEVNQQGFLQFYRPTRLLQALAAAGGLTQFSNKQITVFRDVDGTEERIRIHYKRLISGEAADGNIFLMPGDTLVVE